MNSAWNRHPHKEHVYVFNVSPMYVSTITTHQYQYHEKFYKEHRYGGMMIFFSRIAFVYAVHRQFCVQSPLFYHTTLLVLNGGLFSLRIYFSGSLFFFRRH